MIFYTTIRIPNRPKRYARESQGQVWFSACRNQKPAVPMIPQKKINKKDVHPPSSSNPLPSSLLLCTCVFKKSRETPCTSVFQAISGWGRWDYICKFLYNKKVAIFFRLYHFYVYIPPSPPKTGANQLKITKLSSIFRIIWRLIIFLVTYDSSEPSEQVIETIATTHSNNPLGGIEIIRMNRWDGLNTPWRLFEWSNHKFGKYR